MRCAKSDIGRLFKGYRVLRGMGQTELARRVGTSQGYISELENGKIPSPTIGVVRRIAHVLDIPDDILAKSISTVDDESSGFTKESVLTMLNKPSDLVNLDRATLQRLKTYISAILDFADENDLPAEHLDLLEKINSLPDCSRQAVVQLINSLETISKEKSRPEKE